MLLDATLVGLTKFLDGSSLNSACKEVDSRSHETPMSSISTAVPDAHGRFGPYGGRFVPETLMFALRQLTEQYEHAKEDPEFQHQYHYYLKNYVGRPSP